MLKSVFQPTNMSTIIDNVLNSSMSDIIGADFVSSTPAVNIVEDENKFSIHIAAVGLDKELFDIKIDKDQIIISASARNSPEEKSNVNSNRDCYLRREFDYSSFTRKFKLSSIIDKQRVNASYVDGVLTVELSKKEEDTEHRSSTIKVG